MSTCELKEVRYFPGAFSYDFECDSGDVAFSLGDSNRDGVIDTVEVKRGYLDVSLVFWNRDSFSSIFKQITHFKNILTDEIKLAQKDFRQCPQYADTPPRLPGNLCEKSILPPFVNYTILGTSIVDFNQDGKVDEFRRNILLDVLPVSVVITIREATSEKSCFTLHYSDSIIRSFLSALDPFIQKGFDTPL